MSDLYSIGYATKPIEIFIDQLKRYEINVIADVRSVPYSKVFHDYHRESLISTLKANHIRYVYLGDELGPRSKNPTHYDETGQVQFDRLMQSALFLSGVRRLQEGIKKSFNIAMVCAEKDPAICHRSLLVGYALRRNFDTHVDHIRHEGESESQQYLERRLMKLTDTYPDMLMTEEQCLEVAYKKYVVEKAYRKPG